MAQTRTFQVTAGRIRHICSNCGTKRSLPVPPHGKTRSVRCYKCGYQERCNLNRREEVRESQTGKVSLFLISGKEITVDLRDISMGGVGITLPPQNSNALHVREEVHFKCAWNPKLFNSGRYVVASVNGNRIGIRNVSRSIN